MANHASRKRSGRVIGRPVQPGQVLNPEGRNQYTYRRELETKADELLKGELPLEQIAKLPEWVQDAIEPGTTRSGAIAALTIAGALRGWGAAVLPGDAQAGVASRDRDFRRTRAADAVVGRDRGPERDGPGRASQAHRSRPRQAHERPHEAVRGRR